MKKTLLLSLVALVATPGAAAAPTHHEFTVRGMVCGQTMGFEAPVTEKSALVDAFVGKARLLGVQSGTAVYMVGNSTVVQATPNDRGITVRAVRTVPVCARLRVVFDWSTNRADTPATGPSGPARAAGTWHASSR